MPAQPNLVPIDQERLTGDAHPVDPGAVGALEIADEETTVPRAQHRVVARDVVVGEDEVVVQLASHPEWAGPHHDHPGDFAVPHQFELGSLHADPLTDPPCARNGGSGSDPTDPVIPLPTPPRADE